MPKHSSSGSTHAPSFSSACPARPCANRAAPDGRATACRVSALNHSAPPRHAALQQGFSLMELLVVLFVVIMVTSMVGLNVGSGSEDVKLEALVRELADGAAYAHDEAQFTGQDYGLQLDQSFDPAGTVFNYRWLERRIDGWQTPESGKEIFATKEMPNGISLELEIENSLFSDVELDEDEDARGPQVVFYASGETTVGAINVRRREDSELLWRIEWDLLGRFEVMRNGIPMEGEE